MIIADATAIDPNAWTPALSIILQIVTAIGVIVAAVLSHLGRKTTQIEIAKNTKLTQDVSGKADVAADKADVAALAATTAAKHSREAAGMAVATSEKLDHVTEMVNSRDADRNIELKESQAKVLDLTNERDTAILKNLLKDLIQESQDKGKPPTI